MTTPTPRTLHKPEIMSPAGYWPQVHAAIEAGADAVYFGLKHFTARAKVGFSLTELPDVMRTLHRRGVKGYVTFNTLVFDHELAEAAQSLAAIAATGVDALIVQDIGIARLARRLAPDIEVHGSTQMSITSAEGVALAQALGVSRVVLARELSLDEVRAIRAQTECELEMFVHGALCVSYSGQCFSSEAWGGRSANRGQCAQACRLPYELVVDDEVRDLGDKRYLLSPGDLYALHQIPEIVQIGVSALKIEGRYKEADYVALTTAAYRKAVDEAWAGLPLSLTRREELQLEQVYSRGLGPWFVTGTNHQIVVDGRSPRHRGVRAGQVEAVLENAVVIMPEAALKEAPLKPGDGLVFDAAGWRSPEEPEEGGRIYEIFPRAGGRMELRFGNGAIRFGRIRPGDLVWRSHDVDVDRAARVFLEAETPLARQPVSVEMTASAGEPLRLVWRLVRDAAAAVVVESPEPLPVAANRALSPDFAREQIGRLGGTAYVLESLQVEIAGSPFAPASLLNALRREAVEKLVALQSGTHVGTILPAQKALRSSLDATATVRHASEVEDDAHVQFHLLVRTPEQLDAALGLRPASITLDYLDLYGLRPAVERVQEAGISVRVASPRVLKPNEQRIVNFLLRLGAPILVRSGGLLHALQQEEHPALTGDFSLNAANVLAAGELLKLGLERFTPTHDLNAQQVADLAAAIGAQRIEAIAYQHLPVFHTEHCVFCRFLSTGTSYKDCGHPCESHKLALRDVSGREHPVLADVGCRNTVFGAQAQEASAWMPLWLGAGIRHFRLEFAHESAAEVSAVGHAFQRYASGRLSATELARALKQAAPQGVTAGSLFVPENYQVIPLMV